MRNKQFELKVIYGALAILFLVFLFIPVAMLLYKSFSSDGGISLTHYQSFLSDGTFLNAFKNSFVVSSISAASTVVLAFLLAYTINYTNVAPWIKRTIKMIATLPMLLPTITYGFAIIYSFGKQGLVTKLLHIQLFDIYGFPGLFIGYVIYTLPIAFLLINNTMKFIDKKFIIVSKLMGDHGLKRFYITVFAPLITTLAAAFVQSFFLSFTDFGIPAAVGGEYSVVSTTLYNEMLGAIPNFNNGAVVAMMMLLPSIISILVLNYLERYNIRYNKVSQVELAKSKGRDWFCGVLSGVFITAIVSVFLVILLLPFIKEWPYEISFSLTHITDTLASSNLLGVYKNSLFVAFATAVFGTLMAYAGALISVRSKLPIWIKKSIDVISGITNTIPGMVIGIAFLFAFNATSLQNTFLIIIVCNMMHFFSTPYLMIKNTLAKMNSSFETTAMLMGDNWFKTIKRVVIPNSKSTILDMFSYYFINSMVTISALIFLVGARTTVLTTKIKELQHFAKFDEIFVLSLLILVTNLAMKGIVYVVSKKREVKQTKFTKVKRCVFAVVIIAGAFLMNSISSPSQQIIIYSNADGEALSAMQHTLDENGYKDQYILQSFGTSELGGKLMAEGKHIEADIVTMSSYYIDSAQTEHDMFEKLTFPIYPLTIYSPYYTPLTALEGTLIINTAVMEEKNLPIPTSIKDLTKDIYKGYLSIPDMKGSSTGWLLIQAVLESYGKEEGKEILSQLYNNVGPHLESSGSGPLKKVRAGEVAIAFGLRHQALADKAKGLPIDYVDPIEGNYMLTESMAVIKKDKDSELAMKMVECLMNNGRKEILETYPTALYKDEVVDQDIASTYPKKYPKTLTVKLLEEHQAFSESAKK